MEKSRFGFGLATSTEQKTILVSERDGAARQAPAHGSTQQRTTGGFMTKHECGDRALSCLRAGAGLVLILAFFCAALPLLAVQNEDDEGAPPTQQVAHERDNTSTEDSPSQRYQPLPAKLTLPSGTLITVRVSQLLSSDQNVAGDGFTAELAKPLVVEGWVVARRGQTVLGRVAVAQKAGRLKGTSQLGVELSNLVLVDGQQLPIRTELQQASGGTSHARDAQAIGTTTGLGAIIGAAAGEGEGAAIGAGAGAAAGIAGVLLTRGRPTVIPPETTLTFQLKHALAFSTARSRPAFRPVTQLDYENGDSFRRRPLGFSMAPPYPPPYDWSYYPWGYYYPSAVYFGYYGFGRGFGYRRFHR